MIKKVNCQNGDIKIVAEFGQGDLLVSAASGPIGAALVVKNNEGKEEIGTLHPETYGKLIDSVPGNKIIFTFDNVESVDVVMTALESIKSHIIHNTVEDF